MTEDFLVGIVLVGKQAQKFLPRVQKLGGVALMQRGGWMVNILQWLMDRSLGEPAFTGGRTAVRGQG